jgi:hypothetical protein
MELFTTLFSPVFCHLNSLTSNNIGEELPVMLTSPFYEAMNLSQIET